MANYQITTDSNADIPAQLLEEYEIPIIPQYYVIDDIVYGDEIHLSTAEFYAKMREGVMPGSMANNPSVIRDVFEKLIKEGKDILHIAFSSTLSGSYNNVCMVANELLEEYPDAKIQVIDSMNVSLGEALIVLYAAKLLEDGVSYDEAILKIEEVKSKSKVQFTVDDLFHLQRGGRVSKTTAIVGSVIGVKPILVVNEEGKLVPNGTVRGRKKSLTALAKFAVGEVDTNSSAKYTVGIVHGDCIEEANFVADLIKEQALVETILINDVSPSIGAHAGPGALGVCVLVK